MTIAPRSPSPLWLVLCHFLAGPQSPSPFWTVLSLRWVVLGPPVPLTDSRSLSGWPQVPLRWSWVPPGWSWVSWAPSCLVSFQDTSLRRGHHQVGSLPHPRHRCPCTPTPGHPEPLPFASRGWGGETRSQAVTPGLFWSWAGLAGGGGGPSLLQLTASACPFVPVQSEDRPESGLLGGSRVSPGPVEGGETQQPLFHLLCPTTGCCSQPPVETGEEADQAGWEPFQA